jgi:L-lactate dehydrogenase complex protein LldG
MGGVVEALSAARRDFDVSSLVVPQDLPAEWAPSGVEVIPDTGLDVRELDRIGAVLTRCALGIAETGTVVLDGGPGQGRRALSLSRTCMNA